VDLEIPNQNRERFVVDSLPIDQIAYPILCHRASPLKSRFPRIASYYAGSSCLPLVLPLYCCGGCLPKSFKEKRMEITKPGIDLGVLVRNIDACLAFYCEDLGLPKVAEVPFPGGRTMHRIQIGDSVLKLMQYGDGAPPAGPAGRESQSGIRYFTISVRDLPATVAALETKGHRFSVPLRESRPGVWIAMLEDPDGNTVELLAAGPT
jgi:glyoxylase I family protein